MGNRRTILLNYNKKRKEGCEVDIEAAIGNVKNRQMIV